MQNTASMSANIERIVETFEFLQNWEDRYRFLIELGEKLPPLPPCDRCERHLVQGCVSQTWIAAATCPLRKGALCFTGDSDAATVKGLVALLVALYDGRTPEEVDQLDADALFERLGLFEHLSPTRHVGVYGMVEKIRALARDTASRETAHVPASV